MSSVVAGGNDFSVAAIGYISDTEGVLKGRVLYNAASADYRALFAARVAYSGPAKP